MILNTDEHTIKYGCIFRYHFKQVHGINLFISDGQMVRWGIMFCCGDLQPVWPDGQVAVDVTCTKQKTECSKAVIFVHNSHLGRLMNITLLCQKSNQINILILSNDPTVKSSHCQASGNVTDIQQMSGHLWTSPIRCWHVSDVTHRGMSEHRSSHLTWHH